MTREEYLKAKLSFTIWLIAAAFLLDMAFDKTASRFQTADTAARVERLEDHPLLPRDVYLQNTETFEVERYRLMVPGADISAGNRTESRAE